MAGYEVDPEAVRTEEKLVYAGAGRGSYQQVSSMEMVGAGKGDFEKEKVVVSSGMRLSAGAVGGFACLGISLVLLLIGLLNNWWQPVGAAPVDESCELLPTTAAVVEKQKCCNKGYNHFCQQDVTHNVDQYYYHVKDVKVDHIVPVPVPPPPRKVITHKVMVHTHAFDCDEGVNWQHTWSSEHQRYCCYLRQIGCHTKVEYRPHYHTITKTKAETGPVPVPVLAPPAQVITHVQNVPIQDAPRVIRVPTPGAPHIVPKYVHQKHYVPVPEPSPPQYHNVPVPVKVTDPGKVIHVPVPLPPQTVVKNKVLYKTRHVQVQHVYDCSAGYSNWMSGWSSGKKSWCCAHEQRGCPGSHSGQLSKTVVTHVTTHEGPSYYHHTNSYNTDVSGGVIHAGHYGDDSDFSGTSGSYVTGAMGGSYGNDVSHVVHHFVH